MKGRVRGSDRQKVVRGFALAMGCGAAFLALGAAAASLGGGVASGLGPMLLPGSDLAERGYTRLLTGAVEGQEAPIALFRRALRQDPASAYRWCDLGEALLESGQVDRAKRCMSRALELGPHIAPVVLRAANFYYRTGDPALGLAWNRRVLELLPDYDDAIFSLYDHVRIGRDEIVAHGIPDNSRTRQAFLRHLLATAPVEQFQPVWSQILGVWPVDDALADEYVSRLLAVRKYSAASEAWTDQIRSREPDYSKATYLYNGGFERPVTGEVFNWRIADVSGARVVRDSAVAATGKWSLRIQFDGTENVAYSHVTQRTVVNPGLYTFEALLRTEALTTDEGIGFRIVDAEVSRRFSAVTERLAGTNGWRRIERTLAVPASTRVLEVQVVRAPSLKFDSRINGTAWIDNVDLVRSVDGKRR